MECLRIGQCRSSTHSTATHRNTRLRSPPLQYFVSSHSPSPFSLSLLVTLFTLILYTLLNWQTKVVSIYHPTLKHYQQLQKRYSTVSARSLPSATKTFSPSTWICTRSVRVISSVSAGFEPCSCQMEVCMVDWTFAPPPVLR